MRKQFKGRADYDGNEGFCTQVLKWGYMFHIALGYFLFLYKFPQSIFKQSCQLCLSQALIYKEPMNGRK